MIEPARNATSPSSAPAAAHAERSRCSAGPVHDPAVLNGDRRRERAAHLEQDERHVPLAAPAPLGVLAYGQRNGAHLVRGAHVDAVHLPVRRHRREVHDARGEDDRRGRAREHPHQRPESSDASGLPLGGEVRQPEVGLCEVARRGERQAVAGWSGDEVERRGGRLEQPDEHRRVGERLNRGQRSIEEDLPVVEPAHVDAHRARVDPDHARHRFSCEHEPE